MSRLSAFFGLGILGLALLVGVGASQDTKKEPGKAKGILPPGFKDLELTLDQKAKIYSIQADFKAKLAELESKIKSLRKQENQDIFKVLSDDQREKYMKAKGLESTKSKEKEKEKEKDK